MQVQSLGWEDPLEEEMATRSSMLAGKFHGQRTVAGYSPWSHKESDTTKHAHIATAAQTILFSMTSHVYTGGGHNNPLQCSCLENPMDRGAWWATVHSVANSQTRLKQLHAHTQMSIRRT